MAVPRIACEELKRRMEDAAAAPAIVDVRLKYPYEHSTVLIPGALRSGPGVIDRALPRSDWICARHICLPISAVITEEQAAYVVDSLRTVLQEA